MPAAPTPSATTATATRAYRLGCRGRRATGERHLLALLDHADAPDGYTRLLLGMLYRGGCQLAKATAQLDRAITSGKLAGQALTLACTMLVDTLAQQGELAAARVVLTRAPPDEPLVRAVFELAQGELDAAADRLRLAAARAAAKHRCQRLWALLLLSNVLLDQQDLPGAANALERASDLLPRRGRFEETYVLALTSWLRLEALRAQTQPADGSSLRRAQKSAAIYTTYYPRYRRLCDAFIALEQSRRGRPPSLEAAEKLVADLESLGCVLDAGRIAAQWVRRVDGEAERFNHALRPRAIDLLRRAGAAGWLETIERRDRSSSIDPPTVALARKTSSSSSDGQSYDAPTVTINRGAETSRSGEQANDPPTVTFRRHEVDVSALVTPTKITRAGDPLAGHDPAPSDSLTVSIDRGSAPGHRDQVAIETLFAVNRAISAKLNIDELLQELLTRVSDVLRAERGAVFWYEGERFRSVASRGFGESGEFGEFGEFSESGESDAVELAVSQTVLHDAIEKRRVVRTDDAMHDQRFRDAASIIAPGVRSVLCAPLATPKRVYGALYIDTIARVRAFTDLHRRLLEVFANQAAVAMENAVAFREIAELNADLEHRVEQRTADLVRANERLQDTLTTLEQTELQLLSARKEALEAEMRTAASLQQAIIPGREIIREAGVAFVGITEPASMVGGDFWTYRRFGSDRVLLLIADVSGHGVGPGMLTSFVGGCLTTRSQLGSDIGPSELLEHLSASIHEAADGQLWMTALACLYDRATRTLRAASGGHVRGFLLPANEDSPQAVGQVGTVLGLDEPPSFQTVTFEVSAGSRLLLYTDGVVECENDRGRPYGARRLVKSLVQRRGEPLDDTVRGIISDCKAYCGDIAQEDDLSVVLTEFE
ncbi:MAG: SpoIIE family protein phosphatase [Myxococcota bacterium]